MINLVQPYDDVNSTQLKINADGSINSTISDGTGNSAALRYNGQESEYELAVNIRAHICPENSTSTPLTGGAKFPGDWQDTIDYINVAVGISTDQDSATDGLVIQWSADGVTVHDVDAFSILANKNKIFTFQPARRYVRVQYTNGAVTQTLFNLETRLSRVQGKPSSHRIQDSIVAEDDAELVKAVLTGVDPSGAFQNVNTTADGDLTISDNSSGLSISEGNVTGKTFVHKFGNAPDFDTADGEVTVWDGAEDGTTWELMNYVYSTTDDIDSISSSSAADTQDITIQGLDINYNLVTQTIALTGQARKALDTNLIRVFRAYNDNSVDLIGHVFVYVNGATTGGVPNTNADIRVIVDPVNQQTEMAVYTIPAGKTGYMRDWYMATSGGNKASNYVVKLKSRNFGKVFRVKHTSAMDSLCPIPYQHKYTEPEKFEEKTDIEMTVESIASPAATGNSVSAGYDLVLVDN